MNQQRPSCLFIALLVLLVSIGLGTLIVSSVLQPRPPTVVPTATLAVIMSDPSPRPVPSPTATLLPEPTERLPMATSTRMPPTETPRATETPTPEVLAPNPETTPRPMVQRG